MDHKDQWATPPELFNKLDSEFHFALDACAIPENTKCDRYFSPQDDGLTQSWATNSAGFRNSVWCNPPYGKGIENWVRKAYESSLSGQRVVCLLPARTNPPWWHKYVMKAAEQRFVEGKVPFLWKGEVVGVPFWGSVVVVFGPGITWSQPMVSSYSYPRIRKCKKT